MSCDISQCTVLSNLIMANQPGALKTPKEMELIGVRGQIIGIHSAGKSAREISDSLGVNRSTVYRWIKR